MGQELLERLFNRYFEDWSNLPVEKLKSLLRVKAKTILPSLDEYDFSKKQRVKFGIDPTGRDVHIGHLCPMIVLNIFLKTGHHVDFFVGDFTAKIGDPSGRVSERPVLTDQIISDNLKTYRTQIERYVDLSKATVAKNSDWLGRVLFSELISISQHINVAAMLQRDDFRKRIADGGLTLAELLYGIAQGYDSVSLKSTIEVGGDDQLLNLQYGRELQRIYGQKPQLCITNPLLEGLDGRKMSKSYQNYVALNASLEDKFGKLMSITDELILQYYKSFTYLYQEEIPELEKFIWRDPFEAKKQLATYFVAIEEKSLERGREERQKFEKKFGKKDLSKDDFHIIGVPAETMLMDALFGSGKYKSRGELKRLMQAGAISNLDNGEKILEDAPFEGKVRVGKLGFFWITIIK